MLPLKKHSHHSCCGKLKLKAPKLDSRIRSFNHKVNSTVKNIIHKVSNHPKFDEVKVLCSSLENINKRDPRSIDKDIENHELCNGIRALRDIEVEDI